MATLDPPQRAVLACPACGGAVTERLGCETCAREFPFENGVLRMLPDHPRAGGWDAPAPNYELSRFEGTAGRRRKNRRERAVVEGFLSSLPAGVWIVDVPCGEGRFSDLAIARGLKLCSIDVNLDHALAAAARAPGTLCIQGDLTALPLRPASMAAAICVRASYYFDDDTLARVLDALGRSAPRVLLSYRDPATLVGWWKRVRGHASVKPEKNRTRAQIGAIAERAGLRLVGRAPRLPIREMRFVELTKRG